MKFVTLSVPKVLMHEKFIRADSTWTGLRASPGCGIVLIAVNQRLAGRKVTESASLIRV